MNLPSAPSAAAPVQRRGESGASATASASGWMDVAMRPDLYAAPVQRAGAAGEGAGLPSDGAGKAMPEDVQTKMEGAFGTDFSAVRIHEGPRSQALGALAYTTGADVHFAPGQYQPHSQSGQALLGHELAHVVQQSQGRVRATTQAKGVGVNDDAGLEAEADAMGARAARGESVAGGRTSAVPGRERAPAGLQFAGGRDVPSAGPGPGGAQLVVQMVRQKVTFANPGAITLQHLKDWIGPVDVELDQLDDERENGFLSQQDMDDLARWRGQYNTHIANLESLDPGDTAYTFDEIRSRSNAVQQRMWPVCVSLNNMRTLLNRSLREYEEWRTTQEWKEEYKEEFDQYKEKNEKGKENKREVRKTPTESGPLGLDNKWSKHRGDLSRFAGKTKFIQYVPKGAETVEKALESQSILDAIYHQGKAFWVSVEGAYELSSSSGKVKMIYTFTTDGARSLMEDYLICGSGDYEEDNEEAWSGEARHPDYTIWKTNEIGAYGIGL